MLARRTAAAVAAIVILSVPFAVFAAVSGQVTASSFAALGGATALANLVYGGRPIAYLSVGLLTALTPVAIVSGAVPVAGAGLMAIMCLGVGLSASQGLHRGLLPIPMYLAFMIIAPRRGAATRRWTGPTVVLFTSTSIADVTTTDAQRVAFTLIASALILLTSGITLGWAHYQQAHSPSAAAAS